MNSPVPALQRKVLYGGGWTSYIREQRTTIIVVNCRHTAASMELAQQQCQPLAGINILGDGLHVQAPM